MTPIRPRDSSHDWDLGIAILHTDVVRARVRRMQARLWRWRWLGVVVLLAVGVGVLLAMPWTRGMAQLEVPPATPPMEVHIDGQTLTAPIRVALPAGRYVVQVTRPGMYPWETVLTMTAGMTTTLQAPPIMAHAQQVRRLPAPAADMPWMTTLTDGAMQVRVRARTRDGRQFHTLHLERDRMLRMPALDAVAVGDAVITARGEAWVEWHPLRAGGDQGTLRLTVPDRATMTRPFERVTVLTWRPDGNLVLIGHARAAATSVSVWDVQRPDPGPPLLSFASGIHGVHWHPSRNAALVVAGAPEAERTPAICEAALVVWHAATPLDRPMVTMLPPPARCGGGMAPFAWGELGLWWIAADEGRPQLEYWSLTDGIPVLSEPLDAAPVSVRPAEDGQVWMLSSDSDGKPIAWLWPSRTGHARLTDWPELTASAIGVWYESFALIRGDGATLWVVRFPPPSPTHEEEGTP